MAEELTLSADALAKITGMFDPVNASITKMQEDHKGYTGQAEEIKANVDAFVSKFESKVKDLQTEVKTLMARNERPDASIKTADTGGFVRGVARAGNLRCTLNKMWKNLLLISRSI